jgi:hypothetical protein
MKKLKLDFQHLGNAEVLTRSQLKQIMGGDGGSGGGGGGMCWITTYDQNNNKNEAYAIFTSENCGSSTANSHCVNLIVTQGSGVYRCTYNCGC